MKKIKIKKKFKKKRVLAGEMFGKFPHWKRSTQEIKDDARRGWD